MDNEGYEVGYGKPPKANQFKKGCSGNPKGRPKGSLSWHSMVLRAGNRPTIVTENGKQRILPKDQVIVEQTANQAASGNRSASRDWFRLRREAEEASALALERHDPALNRRRLELIQGFKQRNATALYTAEPYDVPATQPKTPEEEWPINVIR